MKSLIVTLLFIGGVAIILLNQSLHAQTDDTTTVIGILLVQFADHETNVDARACFGFSPDSTHDPINDKYRFEDYWNIFFQESDPVVHPDADFPDNWARGQRGFSQHGSLRRYIDDNSYGGHSIIPYRAWNVHSGLLNSTAPDTSGIIGRSYVLPVTLMQQKNAYEDLYQIADTAIITADQTLTIEWDSLDVVLILFAGINPQGFSVARPVKMNPNRAVQQRYRTSEQGTTQEIAQSHRSHYSSTRQ